MWKISPKVLALLAVLAIAVVPAICHYTCILSASASAHNCCGNKGSTHGNSTRSELKECCSSFAISKSEVASDNQIASFLKHFPSIIPAIAAILSLILLSEVSRAFHSQTEGNQSFPLRFLPIGANAPPFAR